MVVSPSFQRLLRFKGLLVGGWEHVLCLPFSWEFHHPNLQTNIFRRGGLKPPTRLYCYWIDVILLDYCHVARLVTIIIAIFGHLKTRRPRVSPWLWQDLPRWRAVLRAGRLLLGVH